jgi:patatin-related protein
MQERSKERAEQNANVRELRLGLVCYGGVSLAIYMHGITKEVHKLVIASRAFESDPESAKNPFPLECTEHAYWEALRTVYRRADPHIITRVVVDVVAGTSAGGINGIFLCKALAHNLSQRSLRDLWFTRADKAPLLGSNAFKRLSTLAQLLFGLPRNQARPPLDGAAMLRWLHDALKEMDRAPVPPLPQDGRAASLMPDGHPLQLFVTTTDYHGYRQELTLSDPPTVPERRHRHIYEFAYQNGGAGRDQFDAGHNAQLAFAARSTSSFPGAFPPLKVDDFGAQLGDIAAFKEEFFRPYGLSGADAQKTYFMDGGALNNFPFKPAIDAIFKLRAETEVDRYLLYLQPDPGSEPTNPDGQEPTLFGAIWAGVSRLASAQPIVDNLLAVRRFNESVQELNELIEAIKPRIVVILSDFLRERQGRDLEAKLENESQEALAEQRKLLDAQARDHAGYLYEPYLQLRVHSIVDQFATGICDLCGYDVADNNLAFAIRLIVDRWARDRELIGHGADPAAQEDLLQRFDLGYTRRRFAFVLQGINDFYGKDGAPSRTHLNLAKAALHDGIEELRGLINAEGGLGGGMKERLSSLFPQQPLLEAIAKPQPLAAFVERFVGEHGEALDQIFKALGEILVQRKQEIHADLYRSFQTITAQWTPGQRREVVTRYLGFPFWDAMIYPLTRLSEAGELRPIDILRVSPADSTRLGEDNAAGKLKGIQFGHFGAFLRRDWRENDYLWGRMDGAERLIGLLLRDRDTLGGAGFRAQDWEVKEALGAVLAEEEKDRALPHIPELVAELKRRVAALPGPPAPPPPAPPPP